MNEVKKRGLSRDILFIVTCTLLMSLPASYEPHHFSKALLAGALLQSAAYSVVLAWLTRRSKVARNVVLVVLALLFALETYAYVTFDSRLTPSILTLILQTSWKEIGEFFSVYVLSWRTLVFVAVLAALVAAYCHVRRRFFTDTAIGKRLRYAAMALTVAGFSLFFIPLPFPLGHNTLNQLFVSGRFVWETHQEIETMEAIIDRIHITKTPTEADAPVVVLVIGESFNKHHSNLYGYALPTQPLLTAERDSGRLIVYTHAVTPTNGTAYAMRYLFTQKGCGDGADSTDCVLMPAVFRKAHYQVAYFDNQYTRSSGGSLDYSCGYFLNPEYINDHCFDYRNDQTMDYDADFVDHYRTKFRRQARSLNIIHLMGQHFDAAKRYPSSYEKFHASDIHRNDLDEGERTRVAQYDNATYYNDYTLARITDAFKDVDAVVVYLSDHGEQIYDGADHVYGRMFGSQQSEATLKNVYQVPLMVWCSDTYRAKHPDDFLRLSEARDREVCTADIPYLLYDLAGIDFNYHHPERSFIHPSFQSHQTILQK